MPSGLSAEVCSSVSIMCRYQAVKKMFEESMASEGEDPCGYKGMLHALELERDNNLECPAVMEGMTNVQAAAEEETGGVDADGCRQNPRKDPLLDLGCASEVDEGEHGLSVQCLLGMYCWEQLGSMQVVMNACTSLVNFTLPATTFILH